jgi:hypothetical protein
MSEVSRLRKEKLKEDLERLSQCEHEQIFLMIQKNSSNYTCSETGVFVSADQITDDCFGRIEKYVLFCFEQKKRLHEGETKREAYSKLLNVS